MPTLARALVDYDLDLLQIIAAQWDVDLVAQERTAAAEELAAAMGRPEAVETTWARLSTHEQAALYDLINRQGRIPTTHFVRRYGELRAMGPARREREKPWLSPASITEALYYRGLIVRAFEQTLTGAQEHLVVPSDLLALLPQPDPSALATPPGYPVAPPRRVEGGQGAAVDDAATLLAYLLLRQTSPDEWLATGPVPRIDRHLRRPIPGYRVMLVSLLRDLGMIADETFLTSVRMIVNKDIARPWLEAPRLHQLRSLAEAWLESPSWNELAWTPGLAADRWPNDPRLARRAVLEALREVPPEIWWSLDGLIDHIKQVNPDFQRPGGDYAAWYLRDLDTDEILHGFQYWDLIEGTLIRFIVEGPMRWLGLVRLAPGGFLLTPLCLALIGREDWPSAPDPEARITIDEQGVISVPAQLGRYERLQISRFTAWMEPPPIPDTSRRTRADEGGLYLYRLTPQALERVAAEGITLPTHIMPFLQRLSGRTLPANVARMLEAWHARPGEVVVQDAVIITARDLGVYERLRSNPRISRWMRQQVGPHANAVRREDMPALLNALREMGVLPLFEDHEKDDWP